METTNMEAAIARAEELFEKMPPCGRRGKGAAFTSLARSAFEKVFKARAEGFSFVQICAVFEQVGLLPANARPTVYARRFTGKSQDARGWVSCRGGFWQAYIRNVTI